MKKTERKKWEIKFKCENEEIAKKISMRTGVSYNIAVILVNRGYLTPDSAEKFLNKSTYVLHNPFLMNDMEKGAKRILDAVSEGQKITIYGDYDVDGVTSVSILYLYLKRLGAIIDYYIPSRKGEGYGVSGEAVTKLAENGTKLIITVDTGITANKEVAYAKEFGIDFVITDHHECSEELPDAVAVINPKRQDSTYPFPFLAGVGVVFKLLCALEAINSGDEIINCVRKISLSYADLTAIGTIADVMPVVDENRIIVSYGLMLAEKTDKIGLEKLIFLCRNNEKKTAKPKSKKKLTTGFIGFSLSPKINAAGRISDASIAAELFLTDNEETAERYALKLCEINKDRQYEENIIAEEAYKCIESGLLAESYVIVLDNEKWNHGIIGIVSSRITEKYSLPSILISFEGNEDPYSSEAIGKGSGRSIKGMNMVEMLSGCSELLEKYGGHELAAGFTVKRKNLAEFKKSIEEKAKICFNGCAPVSVLDIDCVLEPNEVTLSLASELAVLEPYGVSNAAPVFAMRDMVIDDITPVGMNRHLRIRLSKDDFYVTSMLFGVSSEEFTLDINDTVDVAFNLEINDFMGESNIQLNIKDIRVSETSYQKELDNEKIYADVTAGVSELDYTYIVPEREDFALIYNFLLKEARNGKEIYTVSKLLSAVLRIYPESKLNYVKIKLIVKIIRELNIIGIEETGASEFRFRFTYSKNKTSLDKSNILKSIKEIYRQKKLV